MFFIHIIYPFVPLEFASLCKIDRKIVAVNNTTVKLSCIITVHNFHFSVVSSSLFPLGKVIVMMLMIRAVVVIIPNADPVAVPSLYANL